MTLCIHSTQIVLVLHALYMLPYLDVVSKLNAVIKIISRLCSPLSFSVLLEYLSGSSTLIPSWLLPFCWQLWWNSQFEGLSIPVLTLSWGYDESNIFQPRKVGSQLMGHGKNLSMSSITEENWSTKSLTPKTFHCGQFDLVATSYVLWVGLIIRAQKCFETR